MSDLGPVSFYLGIDATLDCANKNFGLSQEAYVEKILKKHRMWDYKAL